MATDHSGYDEERNGIWQPLVDYCFDLFSDIEKSKYRQEKIKEIEQARKVYAQKPDNCTFPWKDASNVILPLTTITVDNMEPRLVAGLTGKDPIVEFDMEGLEKKDEPTEVLEDWFNSELKHVVKIEDSARDIVHTLLNDGTYYGGAKYDQQEVTRRDFVFDEMGMPTLNEDGQPVVEDKVDNVFDGGKIYSVEFTDMYVPDNAEDWEKTDFIRIVRPTYAELQRKKDQLGYMNIDTYLLKDKTGKNLTEDQQSPQQAIDNIEVTGKEVIEVMQCHLSYIHREEDQDEEDIEDWTEERIVVEIAKECRTIIRLVLLRDLNYKNEHLIKRIRLYPERGKAYGTGIYGKMKSIQDGASDTFNRLMNVLDIVMLPWFLHDGRAGLKSDVTLHPGKGVEVDNVEGVKFPSFNVNPHQYLEFITVMWIPFWERIQSIGDLQLGRKSASGDQTATEVLAVIQEGNIKHNYQSSVFKEEFLSLLRTVYDLYYQFMPFEKTYMFKGKELPIVRGMMRRPYKFRLTGSTEMSNKLIQRKQSEDFYKMVSGNPLINQMKNNEKLVTSYWEDEDPKEWLDATINQIYIALQENPELPQVMAEYLKNKQAIAQELTGEESGEGTPAQ